MWVRVGVMCMYICICVYICVCMCVDIYILLHWPVDLVDVLSKVVIYKSKSDSVGVKLSNCIVIFEWE